MNWGDEAEGAPAAVAAKAKKESGKPKAAPAAAAKAASKAAQYAEDDEDKPMPPDQVTIEGTLKTVVSYRRLEDGKIERKTTQYVLQKQKTSVSKAVLERRTWGKFGQSKGLPAGPDKASTNVVMDDIFLTLGKEVISDDKDEEKSIGEQLAGKKLVMCRICKGDHWTTKCPYKDKMDVSRPDGAVGPDGVPGEEGGPPGGPPGGAAAAAGAPGGVNSKNVYVPVHQRAGRSGAGGAGSSMNDRDDSNTIRVTNISENTREDDLRDLFKGYGHITRCYLATDRITGAARGFAFINFMRRDDAQRAIDGVNGHGYDHLILQVEWAEERKPGA